MSLTANSMRVGDQEGGCRNKRFLSAEAFERVEALTELQRRSVDAILKALGSRTEPFKAEQLILRGKNVSFIQSSPVDGGVLSFIHEVIPDKARDSLMTRAMIVQRFFGYGEERQIAIFIMYLCRGEKDTSEISVAELCKRLLKISSFKA